MRLVASTLMVFVACARAAPVEPAVETTAGHQPHDFRAELDQTVGRVQSESERLFLEARELVEAARELGLDDEWSVKIYDGLSRYNDVQYPPRSAAE